MKTIKSKRRQGIKKSANRRSASPADMGPETTPSPQQLDTLVKLGIDCLQNNNLQESERYFRQVLSHEATHADANHMMGVLAFQVGQLVVANEFFDAAITSSPDVPFYHNNKAAALKELGRLGEAADSCENALRLDTGYVDAMYNLGNIRNEQAQFEKAKVVLEEATALVPQNPDLLRSYGLAVQGCGQIQDAIDVFSLALKINPDFAEVHNDLGMLYLESDRLDDAINSIQASIGLRPDVAGVHINLGKALHRKGQFDAAVASFQQALVVDPNFAAAYNNWGSIHQDVGNYEEAIEKFEKAIDLAPGLHAAHNNLGNAKNSLGKPHEAIRCFENALKLEPENPDTLSNLGTTFRDIGELDKAIDCFLRADFDQTDPAISAMCLECFYIKDDMSGFHQQLSKIKQRQKMNFRAAAASAFVSQQQNIENSYRFCDDPISLVSPFVVSDKNDNGGQLLSKISTSIREQDWDEQFAPGHISAGYRSVGNLFEKNTDFSTALEHLIRDHVGRFYERHKSSDLPIIRQWPKDYKLFGWYIRLMKGGEITAHVHQGWLSGVFYVRLPDKGTGNEGNIEFTLRGYDLPEKQQNYPTKIVETEPGLLVLFPSSLPHRVLPFSSDFERLCVAFDIMPV